MHNVEQMGKLSSLPSDAAERLLSIDQLSAELNKVSEMEKERHIGNSLYFSCPFSSSPCTVAKLIGFCWTGCW